MFAIRKTLMPVALTLGFVLAMAAPASAQGLWTYEYRTDGVYGHEADNITLSIVNLTSRKLVVKSPRQGTSFSRYCQQHSVDSICQRFISIPFQAESSTLYDAPDFQSGNDTVYIYPYRSATWGSPQVQFAAGDYAWQGQLAVYPDGTFGTGFDAVSGEQLGVIVNAAWQNPAAGDNPVLNRNKGKGTWFYLEAADPTRWSSATSSFSDGIYVTPFDSASKYNAMTMTGSALTASLFAGANFHMVLVVREHLGAGGSALDQFQSTLPWTNSPAIGGFSPSAIYQMAQIFTAGVSGVLDHVSVLIKAVFDNNFPAVLGPVTVNIETVNNGLPSGTIIGSATIPADDLPYGDFQNPRWVDVKLSPSSGASLALTPGTQYALVLSVGRAGNSIAWYGSGDVYPGGSMVFGYSTGWGAVSNADFLFQTFVMPDTFNHYMGWKLDFVDQPNDSVPIPPP